jgi:mannose-6-phosphate isomerase-like protein (cupin superfamily)
VARLAGADGAGLIPTGRCASVPPMSHTVVNLNRVKDMAPDFGLSPGLESHFARVPLELEQSGLSLFRIQAGFRVPFGHTHAEQEEVYVVVSGDARVKIGDDVVDLGPWDAVRVPPGAWRGMEGGSQDAEVLAFGAPNTQGKDAEMEQGWWQG